MGIVTNRHEIVVERTNGRTDGRRRRIHRRVNYAPIPPRLSLSSSPRAEDAPPALGRLFETRIVNVRDGTRARGKVRGKNARYARSCAP